jgi:hypothetical protein
MRAPGIDVTERRPRAIASGSLQKSAQHGIEFAPRVVRAASSVAVCVDLVSAPFGGQPHAVAYEREIPTVRTLHERRLNTPCADAHHEALLESMGSCAAFQRCEAVCREGGCQGDSRCDALRSQRALELDAKRCRSDHDCAVVTGELIPVAIHRRAVVRLESIARSMADAGCEQQTSVRLLGARAQCERGRCVVTSLPTPSDDLLFGDVELDSWR